MFRFSQAGAFWLLVALVLALASATAWADTIYVCWDGSGHYRTIQEGIDAAKPGDEVVVCDGVYTGPSNKNLDFHGKAITVRSENGPDKCTIDCEDDGRAFHFRNTETHTSVVDGFTITKGKIDGHGGGIFCEEASPTIAHCVITGNTAAWGGGALMARRANPTIIKCTMSGNQAGWGGAVFVVYKASGSTTIIDCTISGNTVSDEGGGLMFDYTRATIINCTITGNTANGGGGIFLFYGADAKITNCTFSRNKAQVGGGFYGEGGTYATITNCIFWGDSPNELEAFAGPHAVSYCDVQGGWPYGVANINANPRFVDPGNGNFRISAGSPCIDAADNYAVPAGVMTDLDGNPRFVDDPATPDTGHGTPPIVDMGAYEFQVVTPGDLNCDGKVDFDDIDPFALILGDPVGWQAKYPGCPFLNGDTNGDGHVNFDDIDPFVALLGVPCP